MEETGELRRFAKEGTIGWMLKRSGDFECSIGVYPFFDGKLEDFEPVITELIKVCPFPPESNIYKYIKPASPISAHPTTSTPTQPLSSLSPQRSKNAPTLPRSRRIALSHLLSTSAQRLYTVSLASRFPGLQNKRKRGLLTKSRT